MNPRYTTSILVGAAALAITGCTISPTSGSWPIPPDEIVDHLPPPLAPDPKRYEQLSIAVTHADELRKLINKYSVNSQKMDWATGDYTSLGVISALGGAVAGQPGLMNTGAGVSVLGLTARERYQYSAQYGTYAEARQALECVLTHAHTTNNTELQWGISQEKSKETLEAASAIPTTILQATSKVKEGIISRLLSIQSEPVKARDFKAAWDQQQAGFQKAEGARQELAEAVEEDRRTLARLDEPGIEKTNELLAKRNRISDEEDLVPLSRQVEVGKKLVGLPAAINICVAGY